MSRKLLYKLSDLTAQCDPDAPVPQDMIVWEKAVPVGLEQTVMGTQIDIWEAVLKFQELLSGDVILLVLFGSRARGDYGPDSDVNLAVLFRGEPEDFLELELYAHKAYNLPCILKSKRSIACWLQRLQKTAQRLGSVTPLALTFVQLNISKKWLNVQQR